MTARTHALPRANIKVLTLIGTCHFLSHVYQVTLPPLFILIRAELGVSWTAIGLLATLFMAANGLSQLPVGYLVDRIGARVVLVAGLVLEAGAIGAAGLVPGFSGLLVCAFLAGLGHSVFHPANYAILNASIDDSHMGRAFSLHSFSGFLGTASTPIAIVALAGALGWRGALMAVSAVGLVMAVVLWSQGDALRKDHAARPKEAPKTGQGVGLGGLAMLLSVPMLMLFAFNVTTSTVHAGMQTFSIVALGTLHDIALGPATQALSAFLIAVAAGVLAGGPLADRTKRHDRVAMVAFVITAVVVTIPGLVTVPAPVAAGLFAIAGFCMGAVMPSRDMMVRGLASQGNLGKAFGFMSVGGSMGGIVTPVVFGWTIDHGMTEWIFLGMGATMLVGILTVWKPRGRTKDPSTKPVRPPT